MAKQTFTTGQVLTAAQMTSLQQTAMLGGAASAKTASYTLVAADAGTAISMSNASATTITVNTGLFAAGDTVQITNLGAGVCTITAGTATVNTSASLALAQYESGTLDFTSTSAAIFIKGAGAAAASGGMTLLSTTSLSGASTDITGISQDYTQLLVLLQDVYGNASIDRLKFTFNSDTTAANYYSNMVMGENTTTSIEATVSNGYFGNGIGTAQSSQIKKLNGYIVINRYATAGTKFIELLNTSIVGTSSFYRMQGGGIYIGSAVSSVAVGVTAGTITAGTAYIYGVK